MNIPWYQIGLPDFMEVNSEGQTLYHGGILHRIVHIIFHSVNMPLLVYTLYVNAGTLSHQV
jgi:hypothetical protein